MGFRRYLTYLKNKVLRLSASPHAVAAGVASGAAVSCFPFIGVHFFLGFVLAFIVRGNMLAAAIGTAWGNPITFPILFSASYQVGRYLLGLIGTRTPANVDVEAVAGESTEIISQGLFGGSLDAVLPVIGTMCLGALPISIAVFGLFYWATFNVVKRFQTARSERRQLRRAMAEGAVGKE